MRLPHPESISVFFPAYNDAELAITLSDLLADHIRITALSNYGDDYNAGTDTYSSYRGLAEVRFYGTVVPPPVPGDATGDGQVDDADAFQLHGMTC